MQTLVLTSLYSSLPSRECGLKFLCLFPFPSCLFVTPFAGVWIEIIQNICLVCIIPGHSLRGSVDWNISPYAWSKNGRCHSLRGSVDWNCGIVIILLPFPLSLPSRECGLKLFLSYQKLTMPVVTPFAGVWIEIPRSFDKCIFIIVTPFAGVWIEISSLQSASGWYFASLPSRECGLKYKYWKKVLTRIKSLPSRECGLKSKMLLRRPLVR